MEGVIAESGLSPASDQGTDMGQIAIGDACPERAPESDTRHSASVAFYLSSLGKDGLFENSRAPQQIINGE